MHSPVQSLQSCMSEINYSGHGNRRGDMALNIATANSWTIFSKIVNCACANQKTTPISSSDSQMSEIYIVMEGGMRVSVR